jgi:2-C-methyl-D-erythritol 2,4-cyclodiphosphate synthase
MRVGLGYDVHRFAEGRRLVLGGVEIPHDRGLAGFSDADVVAHALADALLGSLALGDLGTHFPDRDPRWRDADSLEILRLVVGLLRERGYRVVNGDVMVIAQAPRIAPYVDRMRANLASAMAVDPGAVSIKATTPEGLGDLGRGLGIAALAVACVEEAGGDR